MIIQTDSSGKITAAIHPSHDTEHLYEGFTVNCVPDGHTHYLNGDFFTPAITEAEAAALLVSERNTLLFRSDWTQLPDVPLATKEAWATYRQALRDITAQSGYPFEITWPVAP